MQSNLKRALIFRLFACTVSVPALKLKKNTLLRSDMVGGVRLDGVIEIGRSGDVVGSVTTQQSTKEGAYCSRRGLCNTDEGWCECFRVSGRVRGVNPFLSGTVGYLFCCKTPPHPTPALPIAGSCARVHLQQWLRGVRVEGRLRCGRRHALRRDIVLPGGDPVQWSRRVLRPARVLLPLQQRLGGRRLLGE